MVTIGHVEPSNVRAYDRKGDAGSVSDCPGAVAGKETSNAALGCTLIEADVCSLPDIDVAPKCVYCSTESHDKVGAGCDCASTKTVLIREGTCVVETSEKEGT